MKDVCIFCKNVTADISTAKYFLWWYETGGVVRKKISWYRTKLKFGMVSLYMGIGGDGTNKLIIIMNLPEIRDRFGSKITEK